VLDQDGEHRALKSHWVGIWVSNKWDSHGIVHSSGQLGEVLPVVLTGAERFPNAALAVVVGNRQCNDSLQNRSIFIAKHY